MKKIVILLDAVLGPHCHVLPYRNNRHLTCFETYRYD